MDHNLSEQYSQLMRDYRPSPYVTTEWPMKDGMYQQYSGYEDNSPSVSGTSINLSKPF